MTLAQMFFSDRVSPTLVGLWEKKQHTSIRWHGHWSKRFAWVAVACFALYSAFEFGSGSVGFGIATTFGTTLVWWTAWSLEKPTRTFIRDCVELCERVCSTAGLMSEGELRVRAFSHLVDRARPVVAFRRAGSEQAALAQLKLLEADFEFLKKFGLTNEKEGWGPYFKEAERQLDAGAAELTVVGNIDK